MPGEDAVLQREREAGLALAAAAVTTLGVVLMLLFLVPVLRGTSQSAASTPRPPLPGVEVRVCDDAGSILPKGEIGNLQVRGPNVFKGYWRMPEKTAEELRDTGFFITGDLGYIDPDGYVVISGRAKATSSWASIPGSP